jgi:PAS domain S-box-containing protein
MAEGEARFRALIEHSSEFIAVIDDETRFLYVNPAAQRVLGRVPSDIVGIAGLTLVHPDDLTEALRQLAECLRSPGVPVRIELRWRRDDRSWRTIVGTAVNLLDDPAVGGIVVNARDLTERLELEERLRHAEKMDAVGRLAGGVAHDFNNLLMVIGGNAEFVRARLLDAGLPDEEVAEIEDAVSRAAALTRQLLAFSRKQGRSPRVVDLTAQVAHLEGMLRRVIGEDIPLLTHFTEHPLPVYVDPADLEQVVVNLVLNARDAVAAARAAGVERGVIDVTTDAVALEPESARRHPGLAPGPYATLVVRDTGVGMDADTQSRAFEPFFTTKERGKGTGLGLATVYASVKQSGGTIELESSAGAGTTLRVFLPLADAPPAEPDARARTAAAAPRGSETILLVEDDATVRATVRRILERAGYAVLEAEHGLDALAICAAEPDRIALVLTDVVMPEMGAAALIARLRARRPGLPVLLMSGYSETALGVPQLDTPGIALIEKPFEPDALARRVRAVLDAAGPAPDATPDATPDA